MKKSLEIVLPETKFDEQFAKITRLATKSLNLPMAILLTVNSTEYRLLAWQGLERSEAEKVITSNQHLLTFSSQPRQLSDSTAFPFLAIQPLAEQPGFLLVADYLPRHFDSDALATLQDLAACAETELSRLRLGNSFNELQSQSKKTSILYRALAKSFKNGSVLVFDRDLRYLLVEGDSLEPLGFDPKELEGRVLYEAVSPMFIERVEPLYRRTLAGESLFYESSHNNRVHLVYFTPVADETGEIFAGMVIAHDVTARKEAEERLRRKEEELRQSQKMEAMGRLSGGIAHDFNNLLTGILGYADLSLLEIPEDGELSDNITEIKNAALRATALIRQLLIFSRHQLLQIRTINLNEVVTDVEKLLRRLIGEDIELRVNLESGLQPISADSNQLEQVILNLAVNARDAMPKGGRLLLETRNFNLQNDYLIVQRNLAPGAYVLLEISDTGYGIPPAVQERIFEPFFTTKEIGKGTGLGLSTVYGIVKQLGGHVSVYSEVNIGTTFKIYLPVTQDATIAENVSQKPPVAKLPVGVSYGTILLIEDDETVRELTARVLSKNGYRVLKALEPTEAMEFCRTENIQLILTDLVMPGMNGRELAKHLTTLQPQAKIVFMSGYSEGIISHRELLEPDVVLIQKPFTTSELLQKLAKVLAE